MKQILRFCGPLHQALSMSGIQIQWKMLPTTRTKPPNKLSKDWKTNCVRLWGNSEAELDDQTGANRDLPPLIPVASCHCQSRGCGTVPHRKKTLWWDISATKLEKNKKKHFKIWNKIFGSFPTSCLVTWWMLIARDIFFSWRTLKRFWPRCHRRSTSDGCQSQ